MTADEFEASTAARSGISVARLRELGRIVRPCFCPPDAHEPLCRGWQSTTPAWYGDDARATPSSATAAKPTPGTKWEPPT